MNPKPYPFGERLTSMRALFCALGVLGACAGCGSSSETKDTVPARPGFQMPEAGASRIDEAKACAELSEALSASAQQLGCSAPSVTCPGYVRPAGGEGCFEYDDASVKACVRSIVQDYKRCSDFAARRCIVTAIPIPGQCMERPPDASADDAADGGGDDEDGATDDAPPGDAADEGTPADAASE